MLRYIGSYIDVCLRRNYTPYYSDIYSIEMVVYSYRSWYSFYMGYKLYKINGEKYFFKLLIPKMKKNKKDVCKNTK